MTNVAPSGAARATASVPITVPAPGRFSTTMLTFCVLLICSAIRRDVMSGPLPGVYGTTILMVFDCAEAPSGIRASEAATAAAANSLSIPVLPSDIARSVRRFAVRCKMANPLAAA